MVKRQFNKYKKRIDFKQTIPSVFFVMFVTIVCLLVLIQYNYTGNKNIFSTRAAPLFTPTATIMPQASPESTTVLSPDGTWELTMKKHFEGETLSYTFLTKDIDRNTEQQVFSRTVNIHQNIAIPYNTWSPDNKYVFLKESRLTGDSYYVFNSNGDLFAGNSQYINVSNLFNSKVTDYSLTEITGWADPNLLIINTKTRQGEQGPSFWFEISSQSFIQLSTHFG